MYKSLTIRRLRTFILEVSDNSVSRGTVRVSEVNSGFTQKVDSDHHSWIADEPVEVGILWGGHLASQVDYDFENGAGNFPGASPQFLIDLDPPDYGPDGIPDGSVGYPAPYPTSSDDGSDQNNSNLANININPNAIVIQGQITIIKDAIPDDLQDFGFTITGPVGANITPTFTLDDDGDPNNGTSNTITFFGLVEGEYIITENVVSGWSLTGITGTETGAEDTTTEDIFAGDTGARTATITVANGEVWTVDFTNEFAKVATILIDKAIVDTDTDGVDDCRDNCLDVDGDNYGTDGGLGTCTGVDCNDAADSCTNDCNDDDNDTVADCLDQCFDVDHDEFGIDAYSTVGPGGNFLDTPHTMARYKSAFFESPLFDSNSYEQWLAEGSNDAAQKANALMKEKLAAYEPPPLDSGVEEALEDFVRRRKSDLPIKSA